MNVKTRLNIALGACAVVVVVMVADFVIHGQLRQRALAEVRREAERHMEAAAAAAAAMREAHRRYPGASYREMALNPINTANLATGIAAEIVRGPREQPAETTQREAWVDGPRDAVLRELVRRVQARVRTSDLLGRLGGDEFALLLVGDSLAQARGLADELLARLQGEPFGHGAAVGVSLGLAQWNGSEDLAGLLARADHAMYEAKRLGRGQVGG